MDMGMIGASRTAPTDAQPMVRPGVNPATGHAYPNHLSQMQIVNKGNRILHSPETSDHIVEMLKTGGRPEESVAKVMLYIFSIVDNAARQAGQEIDDQDRIIALVQLVKMAAELAKAAGAFTLNDKQMQLAISLSIQMYLKQEIAAGRIDPQKLQADLQKGIAAMPPDKQKELNQSVLSINQTAMGGPNEATEPAAEEVAEPPTAEVAESPKGIVGAR